MGLVLAALVCVAAIVLVQDRVKCVPKVAVLLLLLLAGALVLVDKQRSDRKPRREPRSNDEDGPRQSLQHRFPFNATLAAAWAAPGQASKRGSGVLFFAYGGTRQVNVFLSEATAAARTFRLSNPLLNIAIVTNNATVDRSIFTHHIIPRQELLFPGSDCPDSCRPDKLPRQWTSRLYYMALSPYKITWSLDSGVFVCPSAHAHNAVYNYLIAAERSDLWGFDIAHANQAKGRCAFAYHEKLPALVCLLSRCSESSLTVISFTWQVHGPSQLQSSLVVERTHVQLVQGLVPAAAAERHIHQRPGPAPGRRDPPGLHGRYTRSIPGHITHS